MDAEITGCADLRVAVAAKCGRQVINDDEEDVGACWLGSK